MYTVLTIDSIAICLLFECLFHLAFADSPDIFQNVCLEWSRLWQVCQYSKADIPMLCFQHKTVHRPFVLLTSFWRDVMSHEVITISVCQILPVCFQCAFGWNSYRSIFITYFRSKSNIHFTKITTLITCINDSEFHYKPSIKLIKILFNHIWRNMAVLRIPKLPMKNILLFTLWHEVPGWAAYHVYLDKLDLDQRFTSRLVC